MQLIHEDEFGLSPSDLRGKSGSELRKIAKSWYRRPKIKSAAKKELRRRKRKKGKKVWQKKIAAEVRKEKAAIKALEALRQKEESMEEGQEEEVSGYLPVNPVLDQIGAQLVFGAIPQGMGSANHDDGTMDRHMGLDYDWYEDLY